MSQPCESVLDWNFSTTASMILLPCQVASLLEFGKRKLVSLGVMLEEVLSWTAALFLVLLPFQFASPLDVVSGALSMTGTLTL